MNFSWLLPDGKGIPVLMYHRIWPGVRDRITQTPEQLYEQWQYLYGEGYEAISLEEFNAIAGGEQKNSGKKVLLTFDDGYHNNLIYVYPLLKQFNFKATFFIIGDTLEGNLEIDNPIQQKMNTEELRSLDPAIVQLAMHGFHHENFKTTPLSEIEDAIDKSIAIFSKENIPLHLSLAYPYGGRPKDQTQLKQLKSLMRTKGIHTAFRIGNAVAEMPTKDAFEIKRIDIRGTDSLTDFKTKLKKGKLNPF